MTTHVATRPYAVASRCDGPPTRLAFTALGQSDRRVPCDKQPRTVESLLPSVHSIDRPSNSSRRRGQTCSENACNFCFIPTCMSRVRSSLTRPLCGLSYDVRPSNSTRGQILAAKKHRRRLVTHSMPVHLPAAISSCTTLLGVPLSLHSTGVRAVESCMRWRIPKIADGPLVARRSDQSRSGGA